MEYLLELAGLPQVADEQALRIDIGGPGIISDQRRILAAFDSISPRSSSGALVKNLMTQQGLYQIIHTIPQHPAGDGQGCPAQCFF